MGEMTLSKLQKKQYKEIVERFGNERFVNLEDEEAVRLGETLRILEVLGYISRMEINGGNAFVKIGRFEDFDEWHKDKEREERQLSRREWRIAIVSAVIGAAIGLIPFVSSNVIPWIKELLK